MDRQYELQPKLRERYGDSGRAKCVQDTEYHLSYLAAALSYSSPALFADYLRWAKGVMVSYGVDVADVEANLACMREVLHARVVDDGHEHVDACLDLASESFQAADSPSTSFLSPDKPLAALAAEYLRALLGTDRNRAIRLVLQETNKGTPLRELYLHVFQTCQHEIGRLWHTRQISVGQEHYCTAATQLAMSQLYPLLCAQERNGKRLVSISVNGELHEVGLRVVNDLFEADGWDTVYLGANVPPQSALQAIEEHRPHIILISATMTFHVPAVDRLIRSIRAMDSAADCRILVGGYPFNIAPDLWRQVGADAHGRDADEAIAAANRLLELRDGALAAEFGIDNPADLESLNLPSPPAEADLKPYHDLAQLNNELITAQRALAKKNAELEVLHRKLIEADRRKDDFLATLAHELRNPLAPIRTGLQLMRLANEDKTLIESVRRMMENQTGQLVRLVDDLLDVSRVVNGKITLRKATVELYPIVQNAIDAVRSTIDEAGHELLVTLPSEPMLLEADPTRVTQIFTNLLTNAARYTPAGGRIELSARGDGDMVEVSVTDTGIGIPADMLVRIFDMFTQVDRPAERTEGGLGIGLMLVKRLSEMHGGSVRAFSDGPGKGSKFTVRLPKASASARSTPQFERLAVAKRQKILIADDMAEAAKTLAAMLTTLGNELLTARDGLEAIQLVEEFQPDVVLMDLSMPRVNGLEAARRIRNEPWGQKIKLIALTSWGQDADKQRTAAAGFDHHLVKPVSVVELQELLAQSSQRDARVKRNA